MMLSTGFVLARAYDDKVRRTLFAATRNMVPKEEVIRAASELNKYLYDEFQKRGIERFDVVRIRVPFEVRDGKILWDYENLRIQVYKEADEQALSTAMREVQEEYEALKEKLFKLKKSLDNIYELANGLENVPISDLGDIIDALKKEIKTARGLLEEASEEHA